MRALKIVGAVIGVVVAVIAVLLVVGIPSGYLTAQIQERVEHRYDLSTMTVGILGMAFKGESDDRRDSLSYKLKRLLRIKANRVLCTDPYVRNDPDLTPLRDVVDNADLLVVGAPHKVYADLDISVPVIDIWNLFDNGVRV